MTGPRNGVPTWLTTDRLVLRRPRPDDLDDYTRLHTDPRTYAHSPGHMPTPDRCRDRLAGDLADWEHRDLGYAAVIDRATGDVIGWAGLRHKDSDESALNLYYRLAHERIGEGLGREISRAVVAWAVEHRPDVLVTAMVDTVNEASLRTAARAGLVQVGTRVSKDEPDDEPMAYFEAPSVEVAKPEALDGALRDALLGVWMDVNDAGGSVGFLPGAPRDQVASALELHADDVRDGRSLLCLLRDPGGRLRGFGFWEHSRGFPYTHVAWLKRLMVDPEAHGRNLGRVLLSGMVGVARRELPWVELLRLDYRGGVGLGAFYGRAGWTEVGRVPCGLRLSATDYRDDVAMARRVDGAPLR